MYVPNYARETREDVLAKAVREIKLAVLVTPGSGGLQITHLPMHLRVDTHGDWVLESHVSRGNSHWSSCEAGIVSAAIFRGPQAYISPSWYASKQEHGKVVPTWTYIAVHAHGEVEAIEDGEWLLQHLNDLTDENEARRPAPWSVSDAPVDYIDRMTKAIVGLKMTVSRVEASWKMNQNKPEQDRMSVIDRLQNEPAQAGVEEIMRSLKVDKKVLPS